MHRALRLLALAATLAVALPAAAGEVYTWKDANGVTHYSQTPPRQGKYETRSIRNRLVATDGQPAPQVAATESPQCTTARRNIELLQSGSRLQMDSDGDGKADRDLNDTEREKQLQIAETVARVNCAATAKAP